MPRTATAACEDVIRACDKALFDKEKVITLGDLALDQRKQQVESLTKQVEERERQLASPLRNPWFILAIGIVAGGLISK